MDNKNKKISVKKPNQQKKDKHLKGKGKHVELSPINISDIDLNEHEHSHQVNHTQDYDFRALQAVCEHQEKLKNKEKAQNKIIVVLVICIIWMVIEIIYGVIANSLAIMTDAADLLKDIVEFIINIAAIQLAKKAATEEHTFGYLKAENLGAFVSVILIWVFYLILLAEAIKKLIEGVAPVDGLIVLILAGIGLVLNIVKAAILASTEGSPKKKEEDIDADDDKKEKAQAPAGIRAMLINVMGDVFKSFGILVLGIVLKFFPSWSVLDPIYTLILCVVIILTAIPIADECIHELIGGTPEDIEIKELRKELESVEGVTDVHDLHVWNLIEGVIALTCHVNTEDEDRDKILGNVTSVCHKFKIYHTTIQVQSEQFDVDDMVPSLCNGAHLHFQQNSALIKRRKLSGDGKTSLEKA